MASSRKAGGMPGREAGDKTGEGSTLSLVVCLLFEIDSMNVGLADFSLQRIRRERGGRECETTCLRQVERGANIYDNSPPRSSTVTWRPLVGGGCRCCGVEGDEKVEEEGGRSRDSAAGRGAKFRTDGWERVYGVFLGL